MATQLLQRSRQNPFFEQIITCDEKCLSSTKSARRVEIAGAKAGRDSQEGFSSPKGNALRLMGQDRSNPLRTGKREKTLIPTSTANNWTGWSENWGTGESVCLSFKTMQNPTQQDRLSIILQTSVGSFLSTHRTLQTSLRVISTFFAWKTGCEEKNSEQSRKYDKVSPTSLRPRPWNGIAVE